MSKISCVTQDCDICIFEVTPNCGSAFDDITTKEVHSKRSRFALSSHI